MVDRASWHIFRQAVFLMWLEKAGSHDGKAFEMELGDILNACDKIQEIVYYIDNK